MESFYFIFLILFHVKLEQIVKDQTEMTHTNFSIIRKESQSLLDLVGYTDDIRFLILFVVSSDADLYPGLGPVVRASSHRQI